jgi:hypothetical protein
METRIADHLEHALAIRGLEDPILCLAEDTDQAGGFVEVFEGVAVKNLIFDSSPTLRATNYRVGCVGISGLVAAIS